MKKLIVSGLVLAFILPACSDDDDCNLSSDSIVGTYRITAARYQPAGGGADIDIFASLSACEKDDLVIFNDNGVLNYQDAGTVCTPNGSNVGSWSLSGNTLTVDGEVNTVTSFECNSMVARANDGSGGTTTVTFKRQ